MKRIRTLFNIVLIGLCISIFLAGCQKEKKEIVFYRQVARQTSEDGWVFSFIKNGYKDEEEDKNATDLYRYQFNGINIRYRGIDGFYDRYVREKNTDKGTEKYLEIVIPGILIWGSANEDQENDMRIIENLLSDCNSDNDLLSRESDKLELKELDSKIFWNVAEKALNSEWQKEAVVPEYWEKPAYAMLQEPEFINGYKFQVAFLSETGCIDELYIDVLYEDDSQWIGYVQLSDLVEEKLATKEQISLWKSICSIVDILKEEELFIAGTEMYQDKQIAEVDLSRLYLMLQNIHKNEYMQYSVEPTVVDVQSLD